MTSLAAVAACSVLQVTTRLGKKPVKVQSTITSVPGRVLSRTPSAVPADALADAVASAAALTQVTLIPRAAWGAKDPAVTPDGQGEYGPYDALANPNGWLVYDQPLESVLNRIIIHHSALPLTDGPLEIQRLHTEEKGFADVGYHFLINEKGQLFEGRSLQVRGAHTYGANYGSLGICLLGNFEEIQPAPVQLAVLSILLSDLTARYPLITHLSAHLDHNPGITLCPGAHLYPLLPGLAQERALQYGL